MNAELHTRCGAIRKMEITYPAPERIIFPLVNRVTWMSSERPSSPERSRAFDLVNYPISSDDTAMYQETDSMQLADELRAKLSEVEKIAGNQGGEVMRSRKMITELKADLAQEKKGRERDREEFRKGTAAWQKKITNAEMRAEGAEDKLLNIKADLFKAEDERDALKKGLYGAHRN